MKLIRVMIVIAMVVGILAACSMGDSPEKAAKEWLEAMINLDGNKILERTCVAQRENVQTASLLNSAFAMLPQVFFGVDVKVQSDVSDLQFTTVYIDENKGYAHVHITGELRVAVLGVAQALPVDETWVMVKEGGKWRWCGFP